MWQISKDGRIDRLIVFAQLEGQPVPVGALQFQGGGLARQSRFQYAASWLQRPDGRPLDPIGLPLRRKPTAGAPYEAPLVFYDAAPDGWGKAVLAAAFPNRSFGLAEYLAIGGGDRTGDLRFGPTPDGGPVRWVPDVPPVLTVPNGLETLESLLEAADAADAGLPRQHHLGLLVRSSADVGGARPKVRIRRGGHGWIAKFPARGDAFDEPRIEGACLALARACGIPVAEHEVMEIAGRSVLLVKRFDRSEDGRALGYLSAATILKQPPDRYRTDHTYADLAVRAREMGAEPCEEQVFRRLLFNCFIRNTDDHLRNHAFIHDGRWRLSPAFDLVPQRSPTLVMRPAPGRDPTPDPAAAFGAYLAFGLSAEAAKRILEEIEGGLAAWPDLLETFRVSPRDRQTLAELCLHLPR